MVVRALVEVVGAQPELGPALEAAAAPYPAPKALRVL
eukprot:SAG11_NODE_18740_length_482_cov_1.639687_1_plen_37_part_10